MSMNENRADWAEAGALAFANLVSFGDVTDETLTDLISDLGHFAKLRLGLRDHEIVRLFENGIGAWISEDSHPEGDPWVGRIVTIAID